MLGGKGLQFVDKLAYLALLLGRNIAEIIHEGVDGALLAQIFYTQSLDIFGYKAAVTPAISARKALNSFFHR